MRVIRVAHSSGLSSNNCNMQTSTHTSHMLIFEGVSSAIRRRAFLMDLPQKEHFRFGEKVTFSGFEIIFSGVLEG